MSKGDKRIGIFTKWYVEPVSARMKKGCKSCEKLPAGYRLVKESMGRQFVIAEVFCGECGVSLLQQLREKLATMITTLEG